MLTGTTNFSILFYHYRYVIYLAILLTFILISLIAPNMVVLAGDGLGGSVCNGC